MAHYEKEGSEAKLEMTMMRLKVHRRWGCSRATVVDGGEGDELDPTLRCTKQDRMGDLSQQRKRHNETRKKRDRAHQNRETRWLRTGAHTRGEEDDAVPTSEGFNCKNEHKEGIREALGEKWRVR